MPRIIRAFGFVLPLATGLLAQDSVKHHPGFGSVPLYFEENRGQTDAQARYIARSPNLAGFVTQDGWTLSLHGQPVSMHIADANAKAAFIPEQPAEGITNYYLGSRAITNLPHYSSVRGKNIRPGIDVIYHGNERELEYDLVIQPGADLHALWLRFDGSRAALADNGDIVLKTSKGEVRQRKPRVWQEASGHRTEVECSYVIAKSGDVGFVFSNYDQSAELIVDPIISYSTYLNGTKSDYPAGIAADGSGYTYITGYTLSPDFPATSGTPKGREDVFVTKLNPSGTGLVYSTIVGGTSVDYASGIAIDNAGNAYVTGITASTDFPVTVNQFIDGGHAFVLKLGSTGNIVYSTALAGNSIDRGLAIATDASGSAYVAGNTNSTNFPVTPGSYKTTPGGNDDAFVAKLSSTGQISYATYLGGSANDSAMAIAVDAAGNAFVGGITASSNFPTTAGAYSTTFRGVQDAFVVKLNPAGSGLVYATFLGGASTDSLNGLAVNTAGNCYVAGSTQSADFPTTPGAFSNFKSSSGSDTSGFVTKLNATGTALVYSTFLGGNGRDSAAGIAIDSAGYAYVAGDAQSLNFPTTPGALKAELLPFSFSCCDNDMFLAKVSVDGTGLAYSTLLGSSNTEHAYALALDGIGGVYILGRSQGLLYPITPGAYQRSNQRQDANEAIVISKLNLNDSTLCDPSVAPGFQLVPALGGPISFNLTLAPGCPWEAVSDGFNFNGRVKFNDPHSGIISTSPVTITGTVPRNDFFFSTNLTVRVGTASFFIGQAAANCHDAIVDPSSVNFDSSGGVRDLSLTIKSSCNWRTVPGAPWLRVSNPSGTGPASITISAGPNSFSPRSTTLSIAGRSIAVTQSGSTCTATANISVTGTSSQGSDGVVSIVTNSPACAWSAYTAAPWIQLGSASTPQGSGFVPFIVAANPGTLPRTGQILIADVTLSVTQDAGPVGAVTSYAISTLAGDGAGPNLGDGGPALGAYLGFPDGLAFDPVTGNLYIVTSESFGFNSRIRVVTPDGNINTLAGGGTGSGENIPATSAFITNTSYVGVDSALAVYINDSTTRVRKISNGNIVTIAGGAVGGFSGDNGPATNAALNFPNGIAVDSTGNIYIGDIYNNRVRKVSGGTITTFAGGGNAGLGDNGPATSASLTYPLGVALDAASNLLITDPGDANPRVRKVAHGIITTVAGGGTGGDGGPATSAMLMNPGRIAVGIQGDFFFTDAGFPANGIRHVSSDGTISTIANTAFASGLTTDRSGNLYLSDYYGARVLKAAPLTSFCGYSVTAPPQIPPGGGAVQISVTTAAGCRWGALLLPAWLTPNGAMTGVGNGTIAFTAAANPDAAPRIVTLAIAGMPIQVTQSGIGSSLAVNRSTLNFAGASTSPQTVTVTFTNGGGLHWTAASNRSNIVVLPGAGNGNGSFQVSASAGPNGIVTVSASGAPGSPKQIQVNISSPAPGNPFGSFDTPVNNTTGVAGAIPVTGWALDAVEVVKVDIWREPVGSEPAGALVFIGDAIFVDGARPDVEGLYPLLPFNYRAGWGYQMLTNFLPQGNGTFKLHAIAHNKTGSSFDLGTKTIVVDNAHASKPFGTIDTPGQGGTASGNAFLNFGWALTQSPNKIPIDGSTITVVIDGVPVGHPTYNQFRSDIASLFPGLMNSGGAVGFFYIDTTTLSSGVHTISWNVFDNAGHGEGLGSRYFSVFNSGGGAAAEFEKPLPMVAARKQKPVTEPRPQGAVSIEIEEVGRVELPLGAVSGYELVNGERRPLPIGSSLKRGVFYWQPGPGFLGEYRLVFEQRDGTEVQVRVKIGKKRF